MDSNDKIFVAGHKGLVGSAIVRHLHHLGYNNILTVDRSVVDLRNQQAVEDWFIINQPDYVFDAAARVGGIYANDTYSAEFIYDNISIQTNLIHNSWKYRVKKFLFMGSVCIYPKFAPIPVKESSLLTGYLEPTNEAYAIAKISGIKMCEAYHKQYGFNCVSIMPSNLYGPGDNFHKENGHVIPAMISKMEQAKETVIFWGDGSPYREFMYSDDMADACIFLMNHSETGKAELINAGSGEDISIKDLANLVAKTVGYTGEIYWDTTRPNGTPKRPLDFSRIKELGWNPKYTLRTGLKLTYEWYKEHGNSRKPN
jgi:GDP-L-fucose synthase